MRQTQWVGLQFARAKQYFELQATSEELKVSLPLVWKALTFIAFVG